MSYRIEEKLSIDNNKIIDFKSFLDSKTVNGFGDEWSRFDQSELSDQERNLIFESYFSIFPWHVLPKEAKGMDVGCGSGRWAKLVAPKVGFLYCIEPSEALNVARKTLSNHINCAFFKSPNNFIYSFKKSI